MMNYIQMKAFLEENNKTHDEMQAYWESLYDSNWKVKNLTDSGSSWTDLNEYALASLIELGCKANEIL